MNFTPLSSLVRKSTVHFFALAFFICAFSFISTSAFADWTQGSACSSVDAAGPIGNGASTDGNNLVCVSGTWQYPFYFLRSDTTTTCATALDGALRLNGTTVQYCNGTSWSCAYGPASAFSFTAVTGASFSTSYTSNTVTLSGGCFFNAVASCGTNCTDIIHNGVDCNCTTTGGFRTGDTIAIKQTSSATSNTATTATVTVGSITSSSWSVTTECSRTVTSSLSETNPYGSSITIAYSMAGGGGGYNDYGGGGGSSAVLNAGTLVDYAAGAAGGWPPSRAGTTSGSFSLASGATLAAYVGGGAGVGGNDGYGGGGGSGYYGGGGGAYTISASGGGGTNTGGAASGGTATAGSHLAGGNGDVGQGGSGGTGGAGGGSSSSGHQPGGGGGYGGGGGNIYGGSGGSNGANGALPSSGGFGPSLGANNWSTATSLPAAAGSVQGYYYGGNAGLIILNYTSPGGGCLL